MEAKDVIYTAHRIDQLAHKALGTLSFMTTILPMQGGDTVQDVMLREEKLRTGKAMCVVLFTCEGTFPSKHFRIMREHDFETGRFKLPDWIPAPDVVPLEQLARVAIYPRTVDYEELITGPFDIALKNLHYDVRGLPRPRSLKEKKPFRSGYHGRRQRIQADANVRTSGGWDDSGE